MDRRRTTGTVYSLTTAALLLAAALPAAAQRHTGAKMAYNPITGRTEADTRYREPADGAYSIDTDSYFEPGENFKLASHCECQQPYCDTCSEPCGCGDVTCGDVTCGDVCCGDVCCGDAVGCGPCGDKCWYTGFEATFVKPHFGSNTAFTTTDETATSSTSSTTDFDYDLEFSPRVFVGYNRGSKVGLRATWWQFDHSAGTASGSPPASGLGELAPPAFDDVDLSSTIPTDVFTATTSLNAYAIDIEATKNTQFCAWQFGMGCGFRYAYVEQDYRGELADDSGDALGQIDYQQSIEGFGPTVSFEAYRPYGCNSGIFCKARGSLLFGDSNSQLNAVEDLTLTTPFTTTATTASDDLLSICELQVGYRWQAPPSRCRGVQPFYSIAMEGQLWDGAGNATSQDGALGFFGFNSAIGLNW